MSKLQPVRGTQDLLPEVSKRFRWIEQTCFQVAQTYGFGEIHTPIFEFTRVFSRSIGESSDIVSKEMYVFEDRGGESLCLRPEGTASVVRSFISEGLAQRVPLKLYYTGPMFRYERPQKGRYRQFHQVGAEIFGVDKPQADIEIIALGFDTLNALGLRNKFQLELNSLGDAESRQAYRGALLEFLTPLQSSLSEDSQRRLSTNPMRILDSKDNKDRELLASAPDYQDYLNSASREYFQAVQDGLSALGIEFQLNSRLVRGLDYYDHTVFEFTTQHLGAQNAILSGGRYNGLVETLGGKSTPAVGFAAGIERMNLMLEDQTLPAEVRPIAIIPATADAQLPVLKIAHDLRQQGFHIDMAYSGNFSKRMKRANSSGAQFALILGEDELKNNSISAKNLDSGEQTSWSRSDLIKNLKMATQTIG